MIFQGKFKIARNIMDAAVAINEAHEKVPDLVEATTCELEYWMGLSRLTAFDLRGIHQTLFAHLESAGQYRDVAVLSFETAEPSTISMLMADMVFSATNEGDCNPMGMYERFQWIHPFVDGNGRVGGIALAVISQAKYGFMIVPDGI